MAEKKKKSVKKAAAPKKTTMAAQKAAPVKKAKKKAARADSAHPSPAPAIGMPPSIDAKPAGAAQPPTPPGTPNIPEKSKNPEITASDLLAPLSKKIDRAERILTKTSDFIEQKDSPGDDKAYDDPEARTRGDVPMGVIEHLDEFRGRLLTILVMVIVFTGIGFFFSDDLLKVLTDPFVKSGHKLHIFTLAGGFMLKIKAAFGCGVVIGFPFIVFQIWRFIAPAISVTSRMFIRMTLISAIFLFYLGIAFVYFLLLPVTIQILLNFIGNDMASVIGAENYLSFIIIFSVGMGLLFEFPVVIMLLTKMGIVTPKFLTQYRKHAIVIIWALAAVITPTPDPINLTLVAVPLMGFYELSVLASKWIYSQRIKKMTA